MEPIMIVLAFLAAWPSSAPSVHGEVAPWTLAAGLDSCRPGSRLCTARYGHSATLLADGRVLVAGGTAAGAYLASAEIYDPGRRHWQPTGSMHRSRTGHHGVLLSSGRVLVVGGTEAGGDPSSRPTAELYDPMARDGSTGLMGSWTVTPPPPAASGELSSATLLTSGKVLVAGGGGRTLGTGNADLYDPSTNSWSPTGSMITARFEHSAVRLGDGRVLVAGGWSVNFGPKLSSAEIYDPQTGSWSPTGSLPYTPVRAAAVTLADGRVLLTGGSAGRGNGGGSTTAVVYDPAAATWAATAPMGAARDRHTATVLPGGAVLVAGGDVTRAPTAELYDPALGRWRLEGPMVSDRDNHTATLLPGGAVLVVGGSQAGSEVATAELYGRPQAPAAGEPGAGAPQGTGGRGASVGGTSRWWLLLLVCGAAAAGAGGLLALRRRRPPRTGL